MLVLTRGLNEAVIIGDGKITVTILDVKGSQVRVGIKAPREISVHRQEIYERIQAERKETETETEK